MSFPVYYPAENTVLPIFFGSYDGATGASEAISGLATTDIEVYKGTSMTQRSSDTGYALIDTDGISLDGVTGINGISIDLSSNADAGFYTAGSWYHVVIASITADGQTVNFVAAAFRIMPAETNAGYQKVDVAQWLGTAAATPTTAGVPEVDITHIAGSAVSTSTAQLGVNAVQAGGTAWGSGAITANSIATGAITATKFAAGAIDAAALAADAGTEIAAAVWDRATSALTVVGSAGKLLVDNLNATVSSRLASASYTAPLDAAGTRSAVGLASANLDTQIGTLATPAQVNAEVLDVLSTDTFGEPTGVPGATITLREKIGWLYMALRNRIDVTASKKTFYDDGGSAEWEKDLTDDGTTYSESEGNAP